MENNEFSKDIKKSAKELMKARKEKSGFWYYTSLIGLWGWLFALPVVGGAYLGKYLDGKVKIGISWTITFIIIGIGVGIYNIWYFYFKRSKE